MKRRQPGLEKSCGGWAVHAFAPVGESLVGWWKHHDEALSAYLRYYDGWRVVSLGEGGDAVVMGRTLEECRTQLVLLQLTPEQDAQICYDTFNFWMPMRVDSIHP